MLLHRSSSSPSFYRWYKPRSEILKVIPAPNKISKLFATNFSPTMGPPLSLRLLALARESTRDDIRGTTAGTCSSKRLGEGTGCSVLRGGKKDFFISLKWIFRDWSLVAYFMPPYILPVCLLSRYIPRDYSVGKFAGSFASTRTCLNALKIRGILNAVYLASTRHLFSRNEVAI